MSFRIRGQEVNLRFVVDGVPQTGTWVKVPDFNLNPKDEVVEEDYVGEPVSDLDFRHDGWECSGTMHVQDQSVLAFIMGLHNREKNHQRHPDISVQVFFAFREVGEKNKNLVLRSVFMAFGEMGFGNRKEYVTAKFTAKAKAALLMNA